MAKGGQKLSKIEGPHFCTNTYGTKYLLKIYDQNQTSPVLDQFYDSSKDFSFIQVNLRKVNAFELIWFNVLLCLSVGV